MMTRGCLTARKDRSCATSSSLHVRRSNDKQLQKGGEPSLICKRRVVTLLG
ncbi:uncharacterized protein LACBIDRAFT_309450 [Laccaria bicolor S238N-H82]|uniref:Predicted protein n=1 Tax=Laccaria bicolor (strain S238N-H82 / ATCC MYA-4686) TaxID=486041 RepID=B0DSC1_LACBS|nr:uncharacterized protein LACBIDRAFT_309450 [Laccaria bicolor S238N-H82]EDR02450.1 predicted protein [Laccaria bicolor S238N-H82]|eukprot:XP_001886813.1 predicted protein [Laccaria bicolor S238N-H82]